MTKKLMEQVLDALITYRDFINNAHIIEGQFHWLEGTGDAIKALEEALKQEQGEQLARLGWQEIDCPICGGGARAFPKQKQVEPVAWRWGVPKLKNGKFEWRYSINKTREDAIPLYTKEQL